ncbi:MAG TPA: hypothetical protein VMH40_07400 [Myxococcaceae bacterium]|nr:hypothetical protein [Myxococcaceae bacterium]
MVRPASLLPLALLGASLLACKSEVPVPGRERIGTYLLQSVGNPLQNDCSTFILDTGQDGGQDAGLDGGYINGTFVDAGVILSVTYNQTTAPDGGTCCGADGGLIEPYDAGYLTFVEGSGSEYGVIVGQVIDVSAIAPRVFAQCGCSGLNPPDIQVEERNLIALLSPSQAQALGSTTTCAPPDLLLDGGIPPADGGILPPRDSNGIWNVQLVCGVTEEQVQVLNHADGGCISACQSCTIRFFIQGRTLNQ